MRQQKPAPQAKQSLNTTDPYARRSTNAAASWISSVKKKNDKPEDSLTERQGGEVISKPAPKSVSKQQKIRVDIDINTIQPKNQDPTKKPLLKPITSSSFVPTNEKVKTVSLSDYKNFKTGNKSSP